MDIFGDAVDKTEFLGRLQTVLGEDGCVCYAWVLMSNHFHLLLKPRRMPLSHVMRRLLTGYALYFNRRHHRCGYVYQNRYKSILCQKDEYLLELIRYIHLNPVRAGIVKDLGELERYAWSGHSSIVGKHRRKWQSVKTVLTLFAKEKKEAVIRYRRFISDGWAQGKREQLMGGGLRRSLGGWQGVWEAKKANQRAMGDERILGDGEFVEATLKSFEERRRKRDEQSCRGWTLDKLAAEVCEVMDIDLVALKQRHRSNKLSAAKSLFAYWGYCELGMTGKEIAGYLNLSRSTVSERIAHGRKLANSYPLPLRL